MRFTGSEEFVAAREDVWTFLIDPANLGPCSPVPIARVDDRRFRAEARLGSGFFSATVRLDLEVTDVVIGRSVRITCRGGASGTSLDGSVGLAIRSESAQGRTTVDWELDMELSGAFAGQAARLIEERAPDAIERLLACIRREIEA